jgi:hypothetical protein
MSGGGGFTWGYFGGMLDAATGLIYIGNGQYYLPGRSSGHGDPVTGRFLTREAKPEKANPYVPWDAAGAMIAPLGLLAFYYSRRKKDNRWGMWVALFIVAAGAGITQAGCQGGQQPTTATAIYNPTTGTAEVTTGSGTVTY